MLPFYVQIVALTTDILLFSFLGFYLFRVRQKEKELEKKEAKIDKDYHHVVDDALSKERQIIADATNEADRILQGTQLLTEASQSSVDQALEAMLQDMKKDSMNASKTYRETYHQSLKQISDQSLQEFHSLSKEMQETLRKQFTSYQQTLLPTMEKELAAYKQTRMQETEELIKKIVHQVAQEMLNKSISLEDHEKLLLESLEKAKQKGLFEQ